VIIATNITEIIALKNQAEKNEKRLAAVLDISSEGMWEWNTQTNDVFHNKKWEIITGVIDIENSFEEFQRCIFEDDKAKVNKALERLLEEKIPYSIEYRMVRPNDDKQIWILDRGVVIERTEQGKPLLVVGIIQDITEQKNAKEKLTLAASVFTHARESIAISDAAGKILDMNDTFAHITGYSREECIGKFTQHFHFGRQSPELDADMWQALVIEGFWSGEIWSRRKNGEVYVEMKTITAVRDENGITTHYVSLGNDISSTKKHQAQLEHMAHYDILTDLPNRALLADRLSQAILQCSRDKKSIAVVFLDLDGFKVVNDVYGHNKGDELLIALSRRMKEVLREGDSLARIGGDEFVVVLTGLAKTEDCWPILERLLLAASEPVTVSDVVLNVSASIGVTLYPQDNVDADLLLRHADQAMYVAKESGKNRYHLFDTAQDDAVKVQQESLEAIRSALDNHQFLFYYQPKVNMRTGLVIGVEALIRWQHPERGLLNPIDFLPVIENNPMMIELGEWVIGTALSQISQWQAMGINLPLSTSVNIAAVQLQQPNFTQKLTTLLAAHPDVEPHHLVLEVLETSALEDVYHVSAIMNECMALGVNFALDDFGTGYSSLTHLRRLPAKSIKIDQSFVQDMLINEDDLAIVEGVIALAKSFKRNVIAEGVETIEHGTALLQLGCELAQGYGIARPMPASDIPAWIKKWKPDVSWLI
jgi:diguanylate cyclase (GGDEF)-like protein/PAS domain S-box-containing protein